MMQRAFSLRRYRSTPHVSIKSDPIPENSESSQPVKSPRLYHSISKRILRRGHSRRHSHAYGDSKPKGKADKPSSFGSPNSFPQRSLTMREKIVHVLANPDTLFIHKEEPQSHSYESKYAYLFAQHPIQEVRNPC
jgi:hypothetical protein